MNQIVTRKDPHAVIARIDNRFSARVSGQDLQKTVRMILSRYPQRSTDDDDFYVRQMVALLAEYPAEIVKLFQHPKTDPMPPSAFMPSIPQVREVCDGLERRMNMERRNAALNLPEPEELEIDNGTEAERGKHVEDMKKLLGRTVASMRA